MKLLKIVIVLLLIFTFSCSTTATFNQGLSWINSFKGKHKVNVSGFWYSKQWGVSELKQENNRVFGYMGDHFVKGIIIGKKIRFGELRFFLLMLAKLV